MCVSKSKQRKYNILHSEYVTSNNYFSSSAILHNATQSKDSDDAIDIEMQSDMLFILSCLCEGDMHRKVC